MTVTAKFKLSRVTPWGNARVNDDGTIEPEAEGTTSCELEFTPDYANGKNSEWAEATPSGVMRLTVTNWKALERFRQGASYTVTIEPEE